MRRSQTLFATAVLLLGAGYLTMAWKMPRGTLAHPGPGFYPVLVGAMLFLASLGYLFWERKAGRPPLTAGAGTGAVAPGAEAPSAGAESPIPGGEAPAPGEAPQPISLKALGLVGLMALFVLALYYTGYLIAITLLLFFAIRAFGSRRLLPTLAATALMVGSSYLLFVRWLMVPLPKGILW